MTVSPTVYTLGIYNSAFNWVVEFPRMCNMENSEKVGVQLKKHTLIYSKS